VCVSVSPLEDVVTVERVKLDVLVRRPRKLLEPAQEEEGALDVGEGEGQEGQEKG
jgi:hypothetical protein